MARTRYTVREQLLPHFMTCTIVNWLPVFSDAGNTRIVLDSLHWLCEQGRIRLYGYVVMENHLHCIASSECDLAKQVATFKSFTARTIIDRLRERGAESQLHHLAFHKCSHKHDRDFQLWQEGSHPQAVQGEDMMRQKLEYIHHNPVRRGYVDVPEHWRYSSARNYAGLVGLLPVEVDW
jgi:REP element-mobilizing transposase RayT